MPPPPGEPAPIAGQGYELVFEDDFDTLNRDIWMPPPWHGTDWPSGRVTVADSILTISADQNSPTRKYEEVWSLGPQQAGYPRYPNALAWQEGYFEVYCRATNDPWTKLALWMNSLENENSYGLGSRDCSILNSEWDMVENGNRAGRNPDGDGYANVEHTSGLHRNTNGPCGVPNSLRIYHTTPPGGNLCDWHTWGGRWTALSVSTYLDGVLQSSQATWDTTAQPMPFIFSTAPMDAYPPQGPPPVPDFIVMDVDWIRVWQRPSGTGSTRRTMVSFPGVAGSYVSTPHDASLVINGDIDIRCEFAPDVALPTVVNSLACRASTAPNFIWQLALRSNGVVRFTWSVDGTATLAVDSAVLPIVNGQRIAVRVTMDVDNGSSQRVIRFYTAPNRLGTWTQLGSTTTTAGVTSIVSGTRMLEIGSRNTGATEPFDGAIYWFELRNSIDGQVVARADFEDKTPGDGAFYSEDGKLYTLNGTCQIMPGIAKPDLYTASSPLRLA